MKLLLIALALAGFGGCAHSTSDQYAVVTKEQLVHRARSYIEREDERIEFDRVEPAVEYVTNAADGKAFWRVEIGITVPAPPGYRIPPGTPTKRRASVYFDRAGTAYKMAW
jgi:hypothetical protein